MVGSWRSARHCGPAAALAQGLLKWPCAGAVYAPEECALLFVQRASAIGAELHRGCRRSDLRTHTGSVVPDGADDEQAVPHVVPVYQVVLPEDLQVCLKGWQ